MRFIRCLLLVFLPFFLTACSDSRPAGILDESSMAAMMKDIILLNTGIDLTTPYLDDRKKVFASALDQLLAMRNISQEQLTASYHWYLYHPVQLELVMKQCQDSLTALQVRMEAPKPILDTTFQSPVNALVPKLPH